MSHPHSDQLFARDRHPASRDLTMTPETAPGLQPPATQLKASALGVEESAALVQQETEQRQYAEKPGQNPPPFTPPAEPPMDPEQNGSGANAGAGLMAKMEASFGTTFDDVKLHVDSPEAQAIQAKAFARGNEVHFAPGQFNPHSQGGQELMGHELAHIVQQRQGRVQANATHAKGLAVNDDRGLEGEADQMGRLAAAGQQVSAHMRGAKAGAGVHVTQGAFTSSVSLKRKLKKGEKETPIDATQSLVTSISIPEGKRQPTRITNSQGHHAVAWTFMVEAFKEIGVQKLSAKDYILNQMVPKYQELKVQFSYSKNPVPINLGLIAKFANEKKIPSEWRKLISNLTQNYIRLRQLSVFTTAIKHFSKPGGEGPTKDALEEMENGKILGMGEKKQSGETLNTFTVDEVMTKMLGALEDSEILFLDESFRNQPELAMAIVRESWLNTMRDAYPTLWKVMEEKDKNLSGTIDRLFKKKMVLDGFYRLGFLKMDTRNPQNKQNLKRNDALKKHMIDSVTANQGGISEKELQQVFPKYKVKDSSAKDSTYLDKKALKILNGKEICTVGVPELAKAMIKVYLGKDDVLQSKVPMNPAAKELKAAKEQTADNLFEFNDQEYNVNVSLTELAGNKIKMDSLDLDAVLLSNERPQTQYGDTQFSHTVAWVLIRRSYEKLGASSGSFRKYLELLQGDAMKLLDALSVLNRMATNAKKDINDDVKSPLSKLVGKIEKLLKGNDSKTHLEWENLATEYLREYVTVMHMAPTTTYGVAPGGRGEGTAIAILSEKEELLENNAPEAKKINWESVQTNMEILLDLKKVFFEGFIDKPWVYVVYEWETHLKRGFPLLYKQFEMKVKQLSESRIKGGITVKGYKNPIDYLDELRNGSQLEAYKKTYLPADIITGGATTGKKAGPQKPVKKKTQQPDNSGTQNSKVKADPKQQASPIKQSAPNDIRNVKKAKPDTNAKKASNQSDPTAVKRSKVEVKKGKKN